MANPKNNPKTGSQEKPEREFERKASDRGQNKGDRHGQKGQPSGSGKNAPPTRINDEDEMTAGGREGQFSDKDRDRGGQWSPGSSQASDR